MTLCVSTIEFRWGLDIRQRLEYLLRYGDHAKEVLPQLRELRQNRAKSDGGEQSEEVKLFDKTIAAIEARKDFPTLVDLKGFVAKASGNEHASRSMNQGKP